MDFRSDMANGNFVRAAKNGKSSVVFGPTVYDVPLLPFEKQLIETIGVTEEEYRQFTAELKRRGVIRPAAYENIPDVQCIWPLGMAAPAAPAAAAATKGATATILTNIAIGVVISGIGYLLTPKPKMPRAEGGSLKDLGSITGASRFTPSRGFETIAELADYASPIPLIFGLYKDDIGGMLTTPRLIWSRMFSHGTMQRAKLMFVVGEQGVGSKGIQPPELEGIFLGNNALDAVFENSFAFYWHKDSSSADNLRIRGSDKIYGTRGKPHRGDPDVPNDDSDAFIFPLSGHEKDPPEIFCHAYTPTNNATFGVYGAIANGTSYRVNYQLISIPKTRDKKARAIRTLERIKIVGDSGVQSKENVEEGQPGTTLQEENQRPGGATTDRLNEIRRKGDHEGSGRNYSPRMGFIEYTKNGGSTESVPEGDLKKIFGNVTEGDRAKFVISQTSIQEDFYRKDGKGASVDDINSTVESFQFEADSAMQLGEHFEIGGCIWKVVKRKLDMFDPRTASTADQEVTFECVDVSTSVNQNIGLVSETLVVNPETQFIGDSGVGTELSKSINEIFFPLTQVEIATIKNNRPAVATEIGLKSTVFQRLNGLCNFQSLPSPSELNDAEDDSIQMSSGSISASILRSSIFRVFIRNIANEESAAFRPLLHFFVVRGQTSKPQYNYLRFTLDEPAELEYKFVPVSGSEFRGLAEDTTKFIMLSQTFSTDDNELGSSGFGQFEEDVGEGVGNVRVQYTGRPITGKTTFKTNKEFTRGSRQVFTDIIRSYPLAASFDRAAPETEFGIAITVGHRLQPKAGTPEVSNLETESSVLAAFFYAIAGSADDYDIEDGRVKRFESVEYIDGSTRTWLHVEWRLRKVANTLPWAPGESSRWELADGSLGENPYVTVLGSGIGFRFGQVIAIKRGSQATNTISGQADYPATNPFAYDHPPFDEDVTFSGLKFYVGDVTENQPSGGKSQSWRYKVFGEIGNKEEGTESAVKTDIVQEGNRTIKVDLQSKVVVLEPPIVGQRKGWGVPEIIKIHQDSDTSLTWNVDDPFTIFRSIETGNPFKTVYDRVGQVFKITEISTTGGEPTDEADVFFATTPQISDISFYRGFVDKSNSTSPEHEIVYVNEAQLNDSSANMENLTITGLSLKASRTFTALDQMRCWLGSGLPVERLHTSSPEKTEDEALTVAYGDANSVGPSNLFTDLVYYLLTDQEAGAGGLLGMDRTRDYLVNKTDLTNTSKFLVAEKLFFNGPITERTNLRQFISDTAPYFLCNFIISNGKFSLKPAVPVSPGGSIDNNAIQIEQLFTGGNIIEDTFKLEYLGAEERRAFRAVVRYRQERKNKLPEEQVVIVKDAGAISSSKPPGMDVLPEEQFDLTQFCTSEDHAIKVAKYFLALRGFVTHTISFSTTADGLNVQAGSYIKVITESSPYSAANNGSVSSSGVVTSVSNMPDGSYDITYFKGDNVDIKTGTMQVSNGIVSESTYQDIVFSVQSVSVSENIYIVEQLTFSQDGIVDIVASEHPCNAEGQSKIAAAVSDSSGFNIES